jgi:hypothetical protein
MTTTIGRLLRASTTECVVGCRVSQVEVPALGCLVRIPLEGSYEVYGLIADIHIDDDGLIRQLVTADGVDDTVILDNRMNRNVPLEMSVLMVGYKRDGRISHLLPPRPPLSLDVIFMCDDDELCQFTGNGRFGYFRHILRAEELPAAELLASHLQVASQAHAQKGNPGWIKDASRELITLLRDDYPTLIAVLGALGDAGIFEPAH